MSDDRIRNVGAIPPLVVGAIGLAATAFAALSPATASQAANSYLVAWLFAVGLSVGALGLLLIELTARATWFVAIRRVLEAHAMALPALLVLGIPLALGLGHLYPWVHPSHDMPAHLHHLLEHRAPYLNVPFFLGRALGYFAFWSFAAWRIRSWSTAQDASKDPALTRRQQNFASVCLPFYGLTVSFAAFDWIMSLAIEWVSTMFGVYWFAGLFVSGIGAIILGVARARRESAAFAAAFNPGHLSALGRLLFAFTCFWAYIAYCQYMLVWVADIPEEVPYFLVRRNGSWSAVGVFLVLGHFVLPFSVLLSYFTKRNLRILVPASLWMLLAHYADTYWMVMPEYHERMGHHGVAFHWADLTALLGVAGIAVGVALWNMGRVATVPAGDPTLPESLTYEGS